MISSHRRMFFFVLRTCFMLCNRAHFCTYEGSFGVNAKTGLFELILVFSCISLPETLNG